jgi:hypothetical protein
MDTDSTSPLAFLIAPPLLAGDTTLAGCLGHPDLLISEDCALLLAPVYALRGSGIKAEYNALEARQSLSNFLGATEGRSAYDAGLRQMAQHIYGHACRRAGRTHFVDAVYRNYYILGELASLFPDARVIHIRLSPICFLSATIREQCAGYPDRLKSCDGLYRDLYNAYQHLARAPERFAERFLAIDHEDLCRDFAATRAAVHAHLGLETMPTSITPRIETESEHLRYWQESCYRQRFLDVAREYIAFLGDDLLARHGYATADQFDRLKALESATATQDAR